MSFNRIMGCSLVSIIVLTVSAVGLRGALDKADAAPVTAPQSNPSILLPPRPGQQQYVPAGSFRAGGHDVSVVKDFQNQRTCYVTDIGSISCS